MFPARKVLCELLWIDAGQQPHDDGVDRIGRARRAGGARSLAPCRRGREVELQLLSVAQCNEDNRIASRSDEVAGQPYDRERVTPKLDLLSKREPRAAIRDSFIATSPYRSAFYYEWRFAGSRDLGPHDKQAQRSS